MLRLKQQTVLNILSHTGNHFRVWELLQAVKLSSGEELAEVTWQTSTACNVSRQNANLQFILLYGALY